MTSMRWLVIAFLLSSYAADAASWRSVSRARGFTGWRQELQRLTNSYGVTPLNHFCIVVRMRQGEDGLPDNKAFVIWREAHSLRAYGQSDQAMGPLTSSGGDLVDLRRDVVEREDQINGSIVAVTRAYVRNIENKCATIGTSLVLKRGTR